MRKAIAIFTGVVLLLIVGILGPFFLKRITATQASYQLKEPMLISSSMGEPFYMIPKNTVLRFQKGYAEGHQLYTIEVFFKGKLPADQLSAQTPTESTWLYQTDGDDISKVPHQYPLSKEDLVQIMKARKMTRDDLAQIVREWNDD